MTGRDDRPAGIGACLAIMFVLLLVVLCALGRAR